MSKDKPNTVSVTNTKLAAALMALGFQFNAELVQPTGTNSGPQPKLHTQFLFWGPSVRPQFATLSMECATQWEKGVLDTLEPMHPLCVMMRANENYDRLLDWQKKGVTHGLVQVAGGRMLLYRRGPVHRFEGRSSFWLDDLALVAALAGVGIPCMKIEGSAGMHRYELPKTGWPRLALGVSGTAELTFLENGLILSTRAPTKDDPLRLLLEETNPMHPVALGYDALNCRAWLKKGLTKGPPLLLMQEGGTTRQALVTMNAEGRVMAKVDRFFKAPGVFGGT